jgi:hypothetical protein
MWGFPPCSFLLGVFHMHLFSYRLLQVAMPEGVGMMRDIADARN